MHRLYYFTVIFLLLFSSLSVAQVSVLSDDFEAGMGNWSNVSLDDNRNWTRNVGPTPSSGTGPNTGANGSGYYMYLETSSGSAYYSGDSAILQSPAINDAGISLAFQYHLYGTNIGTLAVDVLVNGIWINNIWSVSGQQQSSNGAAWSSVEVDLSNYSVSQIRFRATAAGGFLGDMAIDNVAILSTPSGPVAPAFNSDPIIKSGAIPDEVYNNSLAGDASDANNDPLTYTKISGPAWLSVAANGELSGIPNQADLGLNSFQIEVSDGQFTDNAILEIDVNYAPTILFSDAFEAGFGNWSNTASGDNREWLRDSLGTPSSGTGPATGANSTAYYLYLETSSGQAYYTGDSAILLSPSISDLNIHLVFQYHMYGADIGTLSVDVLSEGSWINDVWSLSGQQQLSNNAAWSTVDVDLSEYSVSQIRFRATAAGGFTGDMAIDSVEINSHFIPEEDADADGVIDGVDLCPETPAGESINSDGCAPSQLDTDNDGVMDNEDVFPLDPIEWLDTDSDGVGDNGDAFPNDPSESADSDGDGVGDNADAFPNDPTETIDSDNDGVGDNSDVFPNDPSETADSDADGVGDNADAFPTDPTETIDGDNDGVGDNSDVFPSDPSETADSDGDGVGNNADAFPNDPTETTDSDNDGVGDNSDKYPTLHSAVANLTILSPATDTLITAGTPLIFSALADDAVFGDISENVQWESDLSGSFTPDSNSGEFALPPGEHAVVALITDSNGNLASRFVRVVVTSDESSAVEIIPSMEEVTDVSSDGAFFVGHQQDPGNNPLVIGSDTAGLLNMNSVRGAYDFRISDNGEVVASVSNGSNYDALLIKNGSGLNESLELTGLMGVSFSSYALDISADAQTIVGMSFASSGKFEAVIWNNNGAVTSLGSLGNYYYTEALRTSDQGDVIVGFGGNEPNFIIGSHKAWRWDASSGIALLGDLEGGTQGSHPGNMTPDGSVVVGYSSSDIGMEAFIWSAEYGMQGLGVAYTGTFIDPIDISADGNTVVGNSDAGPFIWTKGLGARSLQNYLQEVYGIDFAENDPNSTYTLHTVTAISDDGRVITGRLKQRKGGYYYDNGFVVRLTPRENENFAKSSVDYGDRIRTTPVRGLSGEIIFATDDDQVIALDENQNVLWSFNVGSQISQPSVNPGTGDIYFGAYDGEVYSLSSGGTLNWTYTPTGKLFSKPAIAPDGAVYFLSAGFRLHALDQQGNLLWMQSIPFKQYDNMAYYFPAVSTSGQIYVANYDGLLYGLSPQGTILWSFDTTPYTARYNFIRSPVVSGNGMVAVGGSFGTLFAFDESGELMWEYNAGEVLQTDEAEIRQAPVIDSNDVIYIPVDTYPDDGGYVQAIDIDGTLLWQGELKSRALSSPVIDPDGGILIRDGSYGVRSFSSSGSLNWFSWLNSQLVTEPFVNSNQVILGDTEGRLHFVDKPSL